MHAVAKITLGVGAVILLAGILMTVLAGSAFVAAGSWVAEASEGGKLDVLDEDGKGDIGFSFYVEGEYTDDDGDGVWDHCAGLEITVIQKPAVADWDQEEEGEFFFQASESPESLEQPRRMTCDVEDGKAEGRDGMVRVGSACLACYRGTFEFESNQPVWVVNDDEVLGEIIGGIFAGIGASSCLCCGVVTLVLGGILALTMEEEAVPTALQYDSEGRVVMQQPGEILQGASGASASDEGEGSDAVDKWYEQTGDDS